MGRDGIHLLFSKNVAIANPDIFEMESPSHTASPRRADHIVKRVSRACLHCRQRKSRCDL